MVQHSCSSAIPNPRSSTTVNVAQLGALHAIDREPIVAQQKVNLFDSALVLDSAHFGHRPAYDGEGKNSRVQDPQNVAARDSTRLTWKP